MLIKIKIKKKFYLPSDGSAEAGRRRREGGMADESAHTFIHVHTNKWNDTKY